MSNTFNKLVFMQTILKIIACTPNKNFNNDEYHQGVIIPTSKLREMRENIENMHFDKELIEKTVQTLVNILKTKYLNEKEIQERVEELLQISSANKESNSIVTSN